MTAMVDPWPERNSPENREALGCPDGWDCAWWPGLEPGTRVMTLLPRLRGRGCSRVPEYVVGVVLSVDVGRPLVCVELMTEDGADAVGVDPSCSPSHWLTKRADDHQPAEESSEGARIGVTVAGLLLFLVQLCGGGS